MLQKFASITTFVFDVDGVLTDSSILLLENGEQVRKMNIKDGYALQLAIKRGYRVLVISGGDSDAVKMRLEKLGVKDVFMKVSDKSSIWMKYLQEFDINKEQVLFMGDDMPDYELMQLAGLSCTPSDAVPDIRQMAAYVSPFKGGEGCVRDVIEKVLKLRGDWSRDLTVAAR